MEQLSASYTDCRCFIVQTYCSMWHFQVKICHTAVKHNSSVNDQMFCSLMALAAHTYNNRVNNTRLLKQTAPLLLHPSSISQKTFLVPFLKTITTLAATDALNTLTVNLSFVPFLSVFVFNLLQKASKPPSQRLSLHLLKEAGWQVVVQDS